MKTTKRSDLIRLAVENKQLKEYIKNIDIDINNLFVALQGRIRFGTGTSGDRGENISGEFVTYTSNGSANTEDTVAHSLGSTPIGYIVIKQDKGSNVYEGGTAWSSTNIYLKQTGTSVATTLFLLK